MDEVQPLDGGEKERNLDVLRAIRDNPQSPARDRIEAIKTIERLTSSAPGPSGSYRGKAISKSTGMGKAELEECEALIKAP